MATLTMTRAGALRGRLWALRRALGWALILVGTVGYAYAALARPWHLRWGATDAEVVGALPGDELVADPVSVTTRAVTVMAPPEAIWPWLAQLGQGKGGFYSYELIENLLGCQIDNAEAVVPAWQQVRPGDLVRMAPRADMPPAFEVAGVEPGRALVLGHREGLRAAAPWSDSWQFVIVPVDGRSSRLIVRSRSGASVAAMSWALEPGIFVMEQRMLRGIKERAEQLAAQR